MKTNKDQITENEITLSFCPRSLLLFAQFAYMAKKLEEKPACGQARQSNKKILGKMKSLSIALIILLSTTLGIQAQEETETTTRTFQLSLVTPVGTNGLDAWNITNKVSINLYAGYNGGLDGFELSGFGGMLKNNMNGTQISGFGNIVLGSGNGAQLAGNFNYTKGSYNGLQLSGFANILNSSSKAWQISGFSNVAIDSLDGFQLTGFSNVAVEKIEKIQMAGFANYSKGNDAGQISGFSNINNGDLMGVQISGFANVNTKSTKGLQLAGFFNYTKKLNGVQIGTFNYVDSLEKGLPIGVFTIVKNGYRAIEISGNETLYGTVSFKTGTHKFYNILSVGASYKDDMVLWGWGYGIGTIMPLKNNWDLSIELLSYQINEDEWFTEALNQNNKLQITASRKVSDNLNVFGGISFNVNVSETVDHDGNAFSSSITPWDVFDETYGNDTNVKMYPGFTAGIRF